MRSAAGVRAGANWPARRRGLRLAWWRHRRLGLLLGLGLVLAIGWRVAQPGGPALRPVPVLDRGLGAGAVIGPGDVSTVSWPAGAVPAGLLADPVGRTLAGPVRQGEALTDARVLGRSLLAGQPDGLVAVSVRPADLASSGLVRPGDRVDVFAAGAAGSADNQLAAARAEQVATGVLVLAVGGSAGSGNGTDGEAGSGAGLGLLGGGSDGGASTGSPALVLAVDRPTAARLAAAGGDQVISVALLPEAATTLGATVSAPSRR